MHIWQHLLISLSIGAFYLFLSGGAINLINLLPWLIGGVLVDLDHLITYSKRYKTLRLIKIKPETKHKALDLNNLIIENINDRDLKQICKGCEYLSSCLKCGINKSFQKALK